MRDFSALLAPIQARLEAYQADHKRVFATTSCQTNSVVLLHILSRLAPQTPTYFLNTGYHFPETLAFKQQLSQVLGIPIRDLLSPVPRIHQQVGGRLLFTSDPDYCCHINKILPLEPVLQTHDVWINGIRAGQSAVRQAMQVEQPAKSGVLRYHPLLHWDAAMVEDYLVAHDLPRHPLDAQGYRSIGCRPCTRCPTPAAAALPHDERTGRWDGLRKTECGLHTTLG